MRRAFVCSAVSLALLAACGGGDDASTVTVVPTLGGIDAPADAGSTPAVTVPGTVDGGQDQPVDSVDLPPVPVGTDDIPVVPVGTDDLPVVPVGTDDIPVVTEPASSDPLVVAIAALTPSDVCALTPTTDVEAIVGITLTAPIELDFDTLGVACSYVEDVGGTSATVASVELSTIAYELQIDPNAPVVEECTVGGRNARCQDEFSDAAMRVDATVVVALGDDSQPALVVTSANGLDTAIAVAELALSNLSL